MKILMISNMYPSKNDPYFGSFIKNIKEGLELSGCQVDLISINGQGIGILQKIWKYLRFYCHIFFKNCDSYDFIHLSYPSHTFLPFLFKRAIYNKLIVRLHGLELVSDVDNDKWLLLRRYLTKLACVRAALCVVPSKYFKEELDKLTSVNNTYIYPSGGIDMEKFYIVKKYADRLIRSKKIHIGYVGRIDLQKGVDILLKSLALVDFDYDITIIGKGPLLSDMKNLALDLGVKASFLGAINNEDLVGYYNDFSVFVFPTERRGESFGNVAIESMACGTPIIGSNFAGLTEYIKDNKNGFFFEVSNPEDLAVKLNIFNELTDEEKISMSNCSYNTALKYEKAKVSRDFCSYLKRLRN